MTTSSPLFKAFALSSLFLASGIRASIFQEFQDMFDEMHARQKSLLNAIERETALQNDTKKQPKCGIKIDEDIDAASIRITVTGIAINGDKPDATFQAEPESEMMKLEIPLTSGKVEINTQDSFVSVSCQQKESTDQENSSRMFARNINQGRVMTLKPDMQALPKISYEKENKTLIITFACQPSARKQNKKAIAIDVK